MTCLRLGLTRKAWRKESKECVKQIHFCFMMTYFLLHSGVNERGPESVPKWCPNHRNEARYDPPEVRAGRLVRYKPGSDLVTAPEVLEDWDRFNQPAYLLFAEVAFLLRSCHSVCRWHQWCSANTPWPGFAVGDRNVSVEVATTRSGLPKTPAPDSLAVGGGPNAP
jgi:hypothetical protein